MAILRKDLENVKIHAQALNGGELYPLLACIIAGRSWDSIVTGVDKTVMNTTEVRVGGGLTTPRFSRHSDIDVARVNTSKACMQVNCCFA